MEIGWIGEELNVLIRQGATVGPYQATMVDAITQAPVDLTGSIIRGEIRRKPRDTTIVLNWRVTITDAVNGKYEFTLTDEDTAALECGDSIQSAKSIYVHDIEMQDSAGNVLPLYYGKVSVFREVTR
jgi:hypothetical protein